MKRILSLALAATMAFGAVAASTSSASAGWRGPYGGWHGGPPPGAWGGRPGWGYGPRPGWGYGPRPGWGGGYYGPGYYGGNGWYGPGAAAAGAIIGLGVGAAIAGAANGGYQVAPPYGQVGWREHVAWCEGRYRSYNPSTDTFTGYDGNTYRCVGP